MGQTAKAAKGRHGGSDKESEGSRGEFQDRVKNFPHTGAKKACPKNWAVKDGNGAEEALNGLVLQIQ